MLERAAEDRVNRRKKQGILERERDEVALASSLGLENSDQTWTDTGLATNYCKNYLLSTHQFTPFLFIL